MRPREEPCTIDADEIAEFLDCQRSPKRADFVRELGRRDRNANIRERELCAELSRVVERLWQYEGKPDHSVRDPTWTGD